ncbi:MAG: hypothetical protein JSV27_01615 [Candidatus Bathyarchaeota archaeon]|nr:MAG: hypothetical protein JSV27_01615 [Candidatus Bathyarchaeota archaeon]
MEKERLGQIPGNHRSQETQKPTILHLCEEGLVLFGERARRHLDHEGRVTVIQNGEEIIIKPIKTLKISKVFDAVPVDVESDLDDWERVKRELLKGDEG